MAWYGLTSARHTTGISGTFFQSSQPVTWLVQKHSLNESNCNQVTTQTSYTETKHIQTQLNLIKLKANLGVIYADQLGNRSGSFYSSWSLHGTRIRGTTQTFPHSGTYCKHNSFTQQIICSLWQFKLKFKKKTGLTYQLHIQ